MDTNHMHVTGKLVKMPGKSDADELPVECSGKIQLWWHQEGGNAYKSSSSDQSNGGSVVIGATDNEGLADGVDFIEQSQHMVLSSLSGTGRDVGKDHQSIKHVLSSAALSNGKQLTADSPQMKVVSHPNVLTSYPYPDAQYGGLLTAYAHQAMIHPQLYGMHARMPLPLEMEEEPVYVNPKQYHGILRRRQLRAKAELEKKVVKVRKPYLHESRHLHAMRRARGCGGRFVNTKKLESKNFNAQGKGYDTDASANPSKISGSSNNDNIVSSSNGQIDAPDSVIQDMHKVQSYPVAYHDAMMALVCHWHTICSYMGETA